MIFDMTITFGNVLSILLALAIAALYIIDTRYSGRSASKQISEIRKEIHKVVSEVEGIRREFGDTGSALREKIREVELFVRDTFARRDEMRDLREAIQLQLTEIKGGLARIESRLMAGG